MTDDWKARLIQNLKTVAPDDSDAKAREQALDQAFSALVDTLGAAIGVIAEGAGVAAGIQGSKRDGRVRWTHRGRHLAARIDKPVGRCVVSIDTGREWTQQELLLDPRGQLAAADGAEATVDELTERFVTRLFEPG